MIKGSRHTEESIQKIKASAKLRVGDKAPNYGKTKSQEWRKKISDSLSGRSASEETKAKISRSLSEAQGGKNPLLRTPQYHKAHRWIYKELGGPRKCEKCMTIDSGKKYEWANLSQLYKLEVSDWMRMCTSCHRKYDNDYKRGKRAEK